MIQGRKFMQLVIRPVCEQELISELLSHRWKYAQTIVMDGNFVSEHLKMKNPADDVYLADGHGFMVESKRYEEHIKSANDTRVVCTLNLSISEVCLTYITSPDLKVQ